MKLPKGKQEIKRIIKGEKRIIAYAEYKSDDGINIDVTITKTNLNDRNRNNSPQ